MVARLTIAVAVAGTLAIIVYAALTPLRAVASVLASAL